MDKEEILQLASDHGETDDFGYTLFRSDDDLVSFAYALLSQYEMMHTEER